MLENLSCGFWKCSLYIFTQNIDGIDEVCNKVAQNMGGRETIIFPVTPHLDFQYVKLD